MLAFVPLIGLGCAPPQPSSSFQGQIPERPVFGEDVPLITIALWHARDLELTPEQVRALETLRSDFQRTAELKTAQLQRLEFDLQRQLSREQVDLGRVETTIRQAEALRTELRLGRVKTLELAKTTLTVEQRLKLQPVLRGGP
jgi:Spy/CpxP family protein refolding chaperone